MINRRSSQSIIRNSYNIDFDDVGGNSEVNIGPLPGMIKAPGLISNINLNYALYAELAEAVQGSNTKFVLKHKTDQS